MVDMYFRERKQTMTSEKKQYVRLSYFSMGGKGDVSDGRNRVNNEKAIR